MAGRSGHLFWDSGSNHQLGTAASSVRRRTKTSQVFLPPNLVQMECRWQMVLQKNEENEEFCAVVPLADGSFAQIEHLGVNEPTKTLGSMTCPSGCNKGAIKYMQM
jgi:hypothetical protein